MPASLLAIPLLPLASFVLTLLLGKRWGTRAHWLPIVTVLLSFACALAAFFRVRSGEIINQDHLHLDRVRQPQRLGGLSG